MYKILDWAKFAYRFSGSLQAAFETMAYHMFCREFDITKGLPAVYNQKFMNKRLIDDDDAVHNNYYNNGYIFSSVEPTDINIVGDSIDFRAWDQN